MENVTIKRKDKVQTDESFLPTTNKKNTKLLIWFLIDTEIQIPLSARTSSLDNHNINQFRNQGQH